ncbi:Msb2 [Fusarium pseudoanthophilum]|uniref:Msb2 n=1 Tax=Fusarium pseudoanthophilum TaxID=48495 RepID=A0A8H5KQQ5_9HYPO|nr:Msb2 [Fusarium pseudoanthophilum]
MHAKNFIVALALASSSVVEANRPRMYIPRQVKREVENNAPENQPAPVIEKREPADSFIKSLIDKNSRKQASQEDGVNFDPTLPLGFKKSGPSASAPALIIQPTTSEALTTELAVSTDAPTEADTGILLAPSGIVTSKTAAEPAKTTAAAVKEPSTEAPKKEETKPAATSDVVAKPATTEKPKEETKPAATTAPAVEESSSAKTPEKKPVVETKTEAPVPVETVTEPAVVETKTEKPVESKTEKASATKGLLDPVESILTSVLPVASDSKKETKPATVETKTEEPAVETTEKPKTEPEETKPAAVPTTKEGLLDPVESIVSSVVADPADSKTTEPKPVNTETKKETQPAPVETETAKPAEPETTSPAVEKPAATSKGLLDPVETLLSSVLAEPADNKTKDPTADQTESISQPEETGTPTKDPQRDASKPQTDGQTLPTFSPPADETTAAPNTGETSKDGLLDPVETLLSSVLPNQPDVKTTSPEESSAPVDSQPTSASPNGSEQTVSAAPSTEPETTGPAEIIPTSILPDPTNILPVPTDVTSAVPEASSPVTVSPVIPTTASVPEKSESGSPDLTSFLDPNTKFPQTGSVAPTDAPNTTVPEVTSSIDVTPEPTSEPINGTETSPNVTGEPQTTGAPEPTSAGTEEPTNITQSAIPTGAPTNEPSGNTTAPATEPATGPATEPATESATKPVDTASGSVPTGSPATETDAETNGTATVEPTKPATDVETQSAPATEGEQTSAVAPTDEQPSVAPTSQPPVETETKPEPEPTTLVPTAAVPVTSIRPTATLTNTNNWLPTTIVFEPTSIPAQPSQPTETSTSTGLPANIPRVILPNDPNKPIPEGSVPIQLGFLFPFNYKFLARNTVAAAQLFKYLPKGLADAGGFSKDRILVSKIVPLDTQSQWGYITALAKIHYPENMIDSLQADLITPNSPLYNNDLEIVRNLTSVINTKIDIFGDSDTDNNTDNGNSDDANSGNRDVFGNSGEGDKSAKQKATTAGIAVGAVGLSVMYGAAMFLVARRYKRKKQQGHRRASSIGSSQRSSEMQYTGNGSPALMGGALMSRDFSAYGATHAEQGQVRPGGRDSHGSGRSGMGNSARTAYISAPVAAENSLGWN